MTGILIELALSVLLLWFVDKSGFSALGIYPTRLRLYDFTFGLFVAGVLCVVYYLAVARVADNHFIANESFTTVQFFSGCWWVLKSVLFEELIFRGVLLYLAIKRFGATAACILSAAAFGVYHWFSYGAFGNPVQMGFIFLMTGVWGLMGAFAYARTKSLYLSVALHLGWNLVNILVFSKGPLGAQLFVFANERKPEGIVSLLLFLMQIFGLPLLTWLYLKKRTGEDTPGALPVEGA